MQKHKNPQFVFLNNIEKKRKWKYFPIFPFCVITFDTIRIKTSQACQNNRLNLSFEKDEHTTYCKKIVRNGHNTVIQKGTFVSNQSLLGIYNFAKRRKILLQKSCTERVNNFQAQNQVKMKNFFHYQPNYCKTFTSSKNLAIML